MNTNDFYKELMSQYTFDSEKIKKNVLDPSSNKTRFFTPIKWLTAVGSVAVITVVIGTFAFIGLGQNGGNTPVDILTPQDRLQIAQNEYDNAIDGAKEVEKYITFREPQTAENMETILAGACTKGEDIKILTVYLDDSSMITGGDEIQTLFDSGDENIIAVKAKFVNSIYKKISDLTQVYLVESEETFDKSPFSVIKPDYTEEITIYNPPPILPDPDETDAPTPVETPSPDTSTDTSALPDGYISLDIKNPMDGEFISDTIGIVDTEDGFIVIEVKDNVGQIRSSIKDYLSTSRQIIFGDGYAIINRMDKTYYLVFPDGSVVEIPVGTVEYNIETNQVIVPRENTFEFGKVENGAYISQMVVPVESGFYNESYFGYKNRIYYLTVDSEENKILNYIDTETGVVKTVYDENITMCFGIPNQLGVAFTLKDSQKAIVYNKNISDKFYEIDADRINGLSYDGEYIEVVLNGRVLRYQITKDSVVSYSGDIKKDPPEISRPYIMEFGDKLTIKPNN